MTVDRNKDREIIYQLPSWEKQVQLHFFIPDSFTHCPSFQVTQAGGEWGLQPVHNSFTLPLLPHIFPLLQHRSSPRASVLQDKSVPVCMLHRPQPALAWSPPQAAQKYLLPCCFFQELQGNPCSSSWSTSSALFSDLGAHRA